MRCSTRGTPFTSSRRWPSAAALATLSLITACGASDVQAPVATDAPSPTTPPPAGTPGSGLPPNLPGRFDLTLLSGGTERAFIVHVPTGARGQRVPVVFMLHGASGDGELFYTRSGWREKADAHGFIAVFPTALEYCWRKDEDFNGSVLDPGDRRIETIWVSGELGSASTPLCTAAEIASLSPALRARVDHPVADDVAFIRQIIDRLNTTYAIDTTRIYVSGFSSGGSMASRLSVELSDRLAAVAVNSAMLNVPPVRAARPISVFHTIGDRERSFPHAFGVDVLPLSEAVLTTFPLIRNEIHRPYLSALGLPDAYTYTELTVAGRRLIRFTYGTGATPTGHTFQAHILQGLSHEYPNGTNHPVVMADVLWEFFRQHAR